MKQGRGTCPLSVELPPARAQRAFRWSWRAKRLKGLYPATHIKCVAKAGRSYELSAEIRLEMSARHQVTAPLSLTESDRTAHAAALGGHGRQGTQR